MIIPKKIAIEGIGTIQFHSKPFYKMYLHQNGFFRSNMASSCSKAYYKMSSSMTVNHEIIELLDYAGEECNANRDYEYDMCRQNYIFQVL